MNLIQDSVCLSLRGPVSSELLTRKLAADRGRFGNQLPAIIEYCVKYHEVPGDYKSAFSMQSSTGGLVCKCILLQQPCCRT